MNSLIRRVVSAGVVAGALGLGISGGGSVLHVAAQEAAEDDFSFSDDTATLEAYGWWNKAQQPPPGAPMVPPPPDAPDDGIFLAHDVATSSAPGPVAGAPGLVEGVPGTVGGTIGAPVPGADLPAPIGPTAFGAVRYSIPEGAEGELTLRLNAPANAAPTVVPVVLACPILTAWDGIPNGRFDQAPGYECASGVPAVVAGDTITFVLPAIISNDLETFDLAIVPAGDHPFRMSLAAPRDESLLLTSVPESSGAEGEFDEAFDEGLGDFDAEFGAEGAAGDDFAAENFGAFDDGSFDAEASPDSATSWRPGGQVALPLGNVVNPFAEDASRGERVLAVALLFAIAVGLWWISGQPTRAPRLLGSLGAGPAAVTPPPSRTRGIGRFSRSRTSERPPRLF